MVVRSFGLLQGVFGSPYYMSLGSVELCRGATMEEQFSTMDNQDYI